MLYLVSFNYDRAKKSEIYAKKSSGLVESYFTYTSHSPENSVLGTEQYTYDKSPPFVNTVNLFIHGYDQGTLHYLWLTHLYVRIVKSLAVLLRPRMEQV
jgi:hypothetical protein